MKVNIPYIECVGYQYFIYFSLPVLQVEPPPKRKAELASDMNGGRDKRNHRNEGYFRTRGGPSPVINEVRTLYRVISPQ